MGARRYGISLRVFDSIARERAQRASEMSTLTQEQKFHIYKQPCNIFLTINTNSPLLTIKADFIKD